MSHYDYDPIIDEAKYEGFVFCGDGSLPDVSGSVKARRQDILHPITLETFSREAAQLSVLEVLREKWPGSSVRVRVTVSSVALKAEGVFDVYVDVYPEMRVTRVKPVTA